MTGDLRYPIGQAQLDAPVSKDQRIALIETVAVLPAKMRAAVVGLSDGQLDTPYREGGWTIRQVVHHVPESHANGYIRWKWALTEEAPVIKAYREAHWAALPDSRTLAPELSLQWLDAMHGRWVALMRALSDSDFDRTYTNPESKRTFTLTQSLVLYAWHGQHHVAHITGLRARSGW